MVFSLQEEVTSWSRQGQGLLWAGLGAVQETASADGTGPPATAQLQPRVARQEAPLLTEKGISWKRWAQGSDASPS